VIRKGKFQRTAMTLTQGTRFSISTGGGERSFSGVGRDRGRIKIRPGLRGFGGRSDSGSEVRHQIEKKARRVKHPKSAPWGFGLKRENSFSKS